MNVPFCVGVPEKMPVANGAPAHDVNVAPNGVGSFTMKRLMMSPGGAVAETWKATGVPTVPLTVAGALTTGA